MIQTLRRFAFACLLMCAVLPMPVRAAAGDAFFETSLGDFAAELKAAQQQGKQGVLLMFEAEGCPYCKRMRESVLNQAVVQQYFRKHFVAYPVDFLGSVTITDFAGKEMSEKAFARSVKVRGTPTFLFVGVDGREMARYTGATRDVEEFMALGRYVAEGRWQKQTFDQFRSTR